MQQESAGGRVDLGSGEQPLRTLGTVQSAAEIARIEETGDSLTHKIMQLLHRSLLTPFDRGAITSLIGSMDDAIDQMYQTANAVSIYEVTAFEPEMQDMAAIIVDAARLTAEAMPLLLVLVYWVLREFREHDGRIIARQIGAHRECILTHFRE